MDEIISPWICGERLAPIDNNQENITYSFNL